MNDDVSLWDGVFWFVLLIVFFSCGLYAGYTLGLHNAADCPVCVKKVCVPSQVICDCGVPTTSTTLWWEKEGF